MAYPNVVLDITVAYLNKVHPAPIAISLYPIFTSSFTAATVSALFIGPSIVTVWRTHFTLFSAVADAMIQVSSHAYFASGDTAVYSSLVLVSGVNVPVKSVVLKSYPIVPKQTVDFVRSPMAPATHAIGFVGYRARETYILLAAVVTPALTVSSSRKPTKASCVIAVI